METIFIFMVGYLCGVGIMSILYPLIQAYIKSVSDKPKEPKVPDLKFPSVWEMGYDTPSIYRNPINLLFNKYILGKGNLAEFIRHVPCVTDHHHIGAITLTFHMVKRRYSSKQLGQSDKLHHSIILKRKDVEVKHDSTA